MSDHVGRCPGSTIFGGVRILCDRPIGHEGQHLMEGRVTFTDPEMDSPDLARSGTDPEQEPWHDALYEVAYDWWRFRQASDPVSAADALVKLANSMSDLLSWHPAWDAETGTWPWEREEE